MMTGDIVIKVSPSIVEVTYARSLDRFGAAHLAAIIAACRDALGDDSESGHGCCVCDHDFKVVGSSEEEWKAHMDRVMELGRGG